MPSDAPKAAAHSRSLAGRLGETAVAATTRSAPRVRTAAASTTPESTPPEKATSTPGSGANCAASASSRSSSVLTQARLSRGGEADGHPGGGAAVLQERGQPP